MSKTSNGKAKRQLRVQRVVSRRPKSKLYEITAMVTYATVIVATSEADALEHVKTWEQAWAEPSNADLVGVSDVSLSSVRARECNDEDWQDEAHDRTCKAAKAALNALLTQGQNESSSPTAGAEAPPNVH